MGHPHIGNSAFRYTSITDLEITSAGDIKNSAFKEMTGNQKTVINNSGVVGDSAFVRSSIADLKITSTGDIKNSAFKGMTSNQKTLINSGGVVGDSAFIRSSIADLEILNTVGAIGHSAFREMSNNSQIIIANYGSIGTYAFQNSDIGTATIGCSGNIGNYAFQNSTVSSVTWGETFGATSIGNSTFEGCASLGSIVIPNVVQTLGTSAFSGCTSMQSAVVGNGVTALPISTFNGCSSLASVIIGANVASIGDNCFAGCSALPQITVPSKVVTVGNNVFNSCTSLARVVFSDNVNSKLTLGNGGTSRAMFADCPLDTVYVGAKLSYTKTSAAGYSPFKGNTSLRAIEFAQAEDSIYDYEFNGCTNLQSVYVGDNIKNIGNSAFYGSSKLKSLVPASLITVAENGTRTVPAGVYVGNAVTNLGSAAFQNCVSIQKAVVGDNVPLINNNTFSGCSAMNSVKIGSKVKKINSYAFVNCSSLPQIIIPAANDSIKNCAFYGCTSLADVIINDSENELYIGSCGASPMFADCPLDSLYIGRKTRYTATENAGYSPFYNNTSLRTVTVGDLETQIYDYEFYNCTGLTDVVIGDGVTDIKIWAFSGCVGLTNFLCGESVATVGDEAFSDCTSMVKFVTESETPPVCGELALADIDVWACILYVPVGSVEAYAAADQWNGFFFVEGFEKKYTLKYVVDGEVYATYSLVEGEATVQPETPTRDGYTFSGWSEIPATMPDNDVTITGSFSIIKYILTYIVDGEVYATEESVPGVKITPIDAPEKEELRFIEWVGLPTVMPANDIEVVARYNAVSVTITIASHGSTTYCSPYSLDFSEVEGLRAYAATGYKTSTGIITMTKVNTVKEGVGLFLQGAPGTYTVPVLDETDENTLNLMVGTLVKTTVNGTSDNGLYANFKYALKSGVAMFYRYADGSSISAGKAYLQLPLSWLPSTASYAIGIRFEDGFTTDIEEVETDGEEVIYYDLNGRRVLEPVKGVVYIVNGKKVIF